MSSQKTAEMMDVDLRTDASQPPGAPRWERMSVVVPTFNEQTRIEPTLATIAAYMSRRYISYEIIVSDDGSTDRTGAIVERLGRRGLPIRPVRTERNRGKGSAVRRGVSASVGDLVLVTDADLSTPIEEAEALAVRIRAGADIAIGSRGLDASRLVVRQPLHRELLGRGFNLLVQLSVLPGIFDTQCGFKLFRGAVARNLFAHATLDGFAFDVEVLSLAARAAYRVVEVPVRWAHANRSRVSPARDGLAMFLDLVKVAVRLRTGAYDLAALAAVTAEPKTVVIARKP